MVAGVNDQWIPVPDKDGIKNTRTQADAAEIKQDIKEAEEQGDFDIKEAAKHGSERKRNKRAQ